MTIAGEIRKQIEKKKGLKLAVGEINNHLSILENLVRKDIMEQVDEAYQKGYDAGIIASSFVDKSDEAYQRGLDEAWGAAKKIAVLPCYGGMEGTALKTIFGTLDIHEIFDKIRPSEAIAKLKAYEEKPKADNDKFKFGDEIIDSCGVKGCVVSKDNEGCDTMYALFDGCRVPQYVTQSEYRKTGKHYDIEKLWEEIRK